MQTDIERLKGLLVLTDRGNPVTEVHMQVLQMLERKIDTLTVEFQATPMWFGLLLTREHKIIVAKILALQDVYQDIIKKILDNDFETLTEQNQILRGENVGSN